MDASVPAHYQPKILGGNNPWGALPYDPDQLTPGVVALGFGNFARAFILRFLNELAKNGHTDVGVVGIGRSDREERLFSTLAAQNNRYHLIEQHETESVEQIGVLRGTIIGQRETAAAVDRIAHPDTKLVTMTVTKEGYQPDERTDSDIVSIGSGDYESVQNITSWLVAGLHKRYVNGQPPFTVLSCDNHSGNGDMVRKITVGMAEAIDPDFGAYVRDRVVFPNTVVDRVAPKQNYDRNALHMRTEYGIQDSAAFLCEGAPPLFVIQNVMSDLFPPLDTVGAKYVSDVAPYAELKLRGLNGAHKVVGMIGKILGIDQVHEVMEDPSVRPFMLRFMKQAMDSLTTKPEGTDLNHHLEVTTARLDNKYLPDQTSRLVRDTWSALRERVVNVDAVNRNMPSETSAFATAIWLRYMRAYDDSGNNYDLSEGDKNRLTRLGLSSGEGIGANLGKFLSNGAEPTLEMDAFVTQVMGYHRVIVSHGLRSALELAFPPASTPMTPAFIPVPAQNTVFAK